MYYTNAEQDIIRRAARSVNNSIPGGLDYTEKQFCHLYMRLNSAAARNSGILPAKLHAEIEPDDVLFKFKISQFDEALLKVLKQSQGVRITFANNANGELLNILYHIWIVGVKFYDNETILSRKHYTLAQQVLSWHIAGSANCYACGLPKPSGSSCIVCGYTPSRTMQQED